MVKKNKKWIVIGIVVIVLVLLGGVLLHLAKGSKSESATKQTNDESLEIYTPDTEKPVDARFIDESGSMDEEQQATYQDEILAFVNEYYGIMFNFNDSSEDFTEKLTGYFGTSDLFKYGNKDVVQNMYKEFVGVHMNSTYDSYHILSLTNRSTGVPEVSITGYVKAHFSNDKVEEGDYDCISTLVLLKEDGAWKICTDQVSSVMVDGTISATENSDYSADHAINVTGHQVMCWDPASADDFLSDGVSEDTESQTTYEEGHEPESE